MSFKKSILVLLIVFSAFLISGCVTIVNQEGSSEASRSSDCEKLASEFDSCASSGSDCILKRKVMVGATLIDISEPEFVTDLEEYNYELTFKGENKQVTFKFYSSGEVNVPLQKGQFYKFKYNEPWGSITSSGPHNSMFAYNYIRMFQLVSC